MIPDRLGHFRVLQKLGAGGMGGVYVAEDTKLGRKVALKILLERTRQDPDRRPLQREAQAVAQRAYRSCGTCRLTPEVTAR
jgi:serine/threonine protein kinase